MPEIARIKNAGKVSQGRQRVGVRGEVRVLQHTLNLVAVGGIVINRGGIGIGVAFECLADFRCFLEIASSDNDLSIAGLPFGQRIKDNGGNGFSGILDKCGAGTGEKPNGLDRVQQHGRIAAYL